MHCVLRMPRMRLLAALPAALICLSTGAVAQQLTLPSTATTEGNRPLEFALTGGASWSDNIALLPADEKDGTFGQAGLLLGYAQKTRRIETSVDANIAYEHYFDNTFDDGVVGGVDASLDFTIVPERLRWFFQENFGQINADPFAATTPDNRENINYFTTGPDLIFQFGSATSLQLGARYSDAQYEISATDGRQYGGSIALLRRLSGNTSVSLNASGDRIEFDDTTVNTDYDRYQAYLNYSTRAARTSLSIDAGYTAVDLGSRTSSGLLARLSITRRLSPSANLTLSGGTQFSDAGDLFRNSQGTQGVGLDTLSVIGTGDPFESRFGSIGYGFSRNRTSFGLSVMHTRERYENATALDRTLTDWNAYFSRRLSPVLELRIFAWLEQQSFSNIDFDDDELRAGAYLSWSVGRSTSLRLQYDRHDRNTSDGSTDYAANQFGLFVTWSPIGRP